MKRCSKCGEEKALGEFNTRPGAPDGLRAECKKCHSAYNNAYYKKHKPEARSYREANKVQIAEGNKRYREENKERLRLIHMENYQKRKDTDRAFRREHPELFWAQRIRNKYGLTVEAYSVALESQNGLCAICGDPPEKGKRLRVDHHHQAGAVRGLLCDRCNTGIGLLRDDPDIIEAAMNYVKRFERIRIGESR